MELLALSEAGQRQQNRLRKSNRKKAIERIANGEGYSRNQALKLAQIAVEREYAEAARVKCPLTIAKNRLARFYKPVCSAEVMGGEKGKYIVGKLTLTESEMLSLAERLAA